MMLMGKISYLNFLLFTAVCAQSDNRESEISEQQVSAGKNSLLTRCFDHWGCLSIGEPFFSAVRPISLFPFHPDALDTHFLLATRSSPDDFQKIRPGKNSTFAQSYFDPQHSVKLIIHGFRENAYQDWVKELIRELLTFDDLNVISVDWHKGASVSYPQAAANTRVLGLVVADFIDFLQRRYRLSPSDVHIIGHDLGAHAAGYAGEQISRIGRITALDPAGPYFDDTDTKVRLDQNDAIFVDVIHADGAATSAVPGMKQAIGHVDFYPTPGWRRTGCLTTSSRHNDRRRLAQCTGTTAPYLFAESINMDCPFYGFACDSYGNFTSGQCSDGCGSDMSQCASMGFKAEEWQRFARNYESVSMFLETGREEPFCRYHYYISVLMSRSEEAWRHSNSSGLLFIKLTGTKGRTSLIQATPGYSIFSPGEALEFVISAPNLGRLLRLEVLWSASPGIHPHPYRSDLPALHIRRIRVYNLETSYGENFCGDDDALHPEHVRMFFRGRSC